MQVTEQLKQDLAVEGAVVARGLFDAEQLRRVRQSYDYGIAHPSPQAKRVYPGTPDEHFNEYGNPDNIEQYLMLIKDLGLADLAASLWDSEHVWFLGEELFMKKGGKAGRSPWHQDTSYMPANGPHLLNIWISFEKLPRRNALEFVRGSHLGTQYDGTSYTDPSDPTKPLWGNGEWPQLPDIQADRAQDAASWDVVSWDLEPGDALVFHSGILHGGAPVTPDCPDRHTLVLRFFGDKLSYRPLPSTKPDFGHDISGLNDPTLRPGDPYHPEYFAQLR
ncbi:MULTISPECIES: phytanoyl-CoA dioxygenase family protein [Mycolicibacter]|uniref:Phytanoyl-CoA dioxygenase n=1 Tax=Mycolicibacter virginiensis TaxID=1795032 RepID=A0A9X7P072_9MYCO|nr:MULTISPECIES: phytanoyl-CoA dioxygenase family protein [Mycobacteriaceae]OBG39664.1 phytanoyl-CoA dioxygenase [Mycolicibacter heraklionensis]OBJ28372.1 phytanoyl-CoA dioxygenase [Mycolicibacter heraklionensis]PQM53873.1 phytanoyl-CoA dioxygenase [Mycolicibacter virginiensis]ULP48760.1 phytanoyl-CoA dioxygenase family protein [Mycolicibacter virginiensis]